MHAGTKKPPGRCVRRLLSGLLPPIADVRRPDDPSLDRWRPSICATTRPSPGSARTTSDHFSQTAKMVDTGSGARRI
jgi:hypothetical protein